MVLLENTEIVPEKLSRPASSKLAVCHGRSSFLCHNTVGLDVIESFVCVFFSEKKKLVEKHLAASKFYY